MAILSTYCVLGKHRDWEVPVAVLPENLESGRIWGGGSQGKRRKGRLCSSFLEKGGFSDKWVRAVSGKERAGVRERGSNPNKGMQKHAASSGNRINWGEWRVKS